MGCPDYVHFDCPACCTRLKLQSKAGDCRCANYNADSVPLEIASDLDGEITTCTHCNSTVKLLIPTTTPKRIIMHAVIGTGKEWD